MGGAKGLAIAAWSGSLTWEMPGSHGRAQSPFRPIAEAGARWLSQQQEPCRDEDYREQKHAANDNQ